MGEEREKICKKIEKNAEENKTERNLMQNKIEELKSQENELKKVLEELVSERSDLQKENRRLYTEQEFRIGEQEKIEVNCRVLQAEANKMREEIRELKYKYDCLVPKLETSRKRQLYSENEAIV